MPEPSIPRKLVRKARGKPLAFDLWLSRFGTISNIVLMVVAVFGFFYTVVPLYRLAATDEQLARKELELSQAEQTLQKMYAGTRSYAVRQFLMALAAKCTGLLEPPEIPRILEAYRDPTGKKLASLRAEPPSWRKLLSIDSRMCFVSDIDNANTLIELTSEDRAHFLAELKKAVDEIEKDRLASLARAEALETEARRNPNLLPEEKDFSALMTEAMRSEGIYIRESDEKIFERAVERGRDDIAEMWGTHARERIMRVVQVGWPSPASTAR